MEYNIINMRSFKVVGLKESFKYENASREIPKLWEKFFSLNSEIIPKLGLNIDTEMNGEDLEYIIGDEYLEDTQVPEGMEIVEVPSLTWAVFPCNGPISENMPKLNQEIFSNWLPNNEKYKIAAGYNLEVYIDPADYENGTLDENYYSEVWIPVKEK